MYQQTLKSQKAVSTRDGFLSHSYDKTDKALLTCNRPYYLTGIFNQQQQHRLKQHQRLTQHKQNKQCHKKRSRRFLHSY